MLLLRQQKHQTIFALYKNQNQTVPMIIITEACSQLKSENYSRLGTWPKKSLAKSVCALGPQVETVEAMSSQKSDQQQVERNFFDLVRTKIRKYSLIWFNRIFIS